MKTMKFSKGELNMLFKAVNFYYGRFQNRLSYEDTDIICGLCIKIYEEIKNEKRK